LKNATRLNRHVVTWAIALLPIVSATCTRSGPANQGTKETDARPAGVTATLRNSSAGTSAEHNLADDESMGGHTLARHVGKSDAELFERLRREPEIASASTYTDRATAERVVGATLASAGRSFEAWRDRTGRRPNFVLHYAAREPIGRSVSRKRAGSTSCERAVVVLRWDERRDRFYVLTSYPEENR
jgi:hypothetical protein